jgi:hypothetical protein
LLDALVKDGTSRLLLLEKPRRLKEVYRTGYCPGDKNIRDSISLYAPLNKSGTIAIFVKRKMHSMGDCTQIKW